MRPSTRRIFLARSGATIAAVGVAGLLPRAPVGPRGPAPRHALEARSRARYAELVAAVVAIERGRPGRAYVRRATREFAGWYERNANLRPMADHVLAGIAAAGGPARLFGDPAADPMIVTEAFALASPPFAPDRG